MTQIIVKSIIGSGLQRSLVSVDMNGVLFTVQFDIPVTSVAEAQYHISRIAANNVVNAEHIIHAKKLVSPTTIIVNQGDLFDDTLEIQQPSPPQLAEALFSMLAPKKTVQHLLGDMQEIFEKNCARFGKARAKRLYWTQVLRAIGPGLWRRVKKLGFIGILIDYGRSKIGL